MADTSGSGSDDVKVEELVRAMGWHLLQGEQLSASYAKKAEEANEEEYAQFFRSLEESYRAARRRPPAMRGIRADDDAQGWWRPPYWGDW